MVLAKRAKVQRWRSFKYQAQNITFSFFLHVCSELEEKKDFLLSKLEFELDERNGFLAFKTLFFFSSWQVRFFIFIYFFFFGGGISSGPATQKYS